MFNQQELFLVLLLLCLIGNNNSDENGDFIFGDFNKVNDILLIVIILGMFENAECNCDRNRDRNRERTIEDEFLF